MRKNIAYMAILVILLLTTTCELETDWDLKNSGSFLVADCIITNEMKYHELKLTHTVKELNEIPAGITGAVVELSDGVNKIIFMEDSFEKGRYISEIPFVATVGIVYRLTIALGDFADTAYARMTGVTPLDTIDIIPYGELFRLNYHESIEPSMTEVYYNWSADTSHTNYYGYESASEVFYTLDNIDVGKLFPPEKEVITFPNETVIIRKKYSLSEQHQKYLRSLLLETEWRGGIFDVEQGNVLTNFSYGIRGWFAACSVLSDTTNFQ